MYKTYLEAINFKSFIERYEYLKLDGSVGKETFGYDRYLNQILYNSNEWRRFRDKIIVRDGGCDLSCEGYDIGGRIIIHHINPITIDDIKNRSSNIFDLNNVICVSHNTHEALHYGSKDLLILEPTVRTKNDTCPWKK